MDRPMARESIIHNVAVHRRAKHNYLLPISGYILFYPIPHLMMMTTTTTGERRRRRWERVMELDDDVFCFSQTLLIQVAAVLFLRSQIFHIFLDPIASSSAGEVFRSRGPRIIFGALLRSSFSPLLHSQHLSSSSPAPVYQCYWTRFCTFIESSSSLLLLYLTISVICSSSPLWWRCSGCVTINSLIVLHVAEEGDRTVHNLIYAK